MNNTGRLLIVALGMAFLATCHQSILTAPPGSTVELVGNPTFIPANGGVSVMTAIVFDATGQPAPDGTVVQFFTDLGRIDEQGRTNDGLAKVNLVADGRSGLATVFALIGGGEGGGGGTTSTTTATTIAASTRASTASTSSAARALAGTRSNDVVVTIGTANPGRILLAADPRNIARDGPRFSTLTATVIDKDGNPIANIPVVFHISPCPVLTPACSPVGTFEESLESRGLPVYTDNNGRARDRVFTARDRDAAPKTVTVTAEPVVDPALALATAEIGVNF